MQRSAGRLVIAALAVLLLGGLSTATAQAQISFGPCPETNDFACGRLVVPIDPSGQTPGTITLAIRRHRAPVGNGRDAVIALAGGPGQAANSFAEDFTQALGPILSTRDLIVFDQRGTGNSHGLTCPALRDERGPASRVIPKCAEEIGPTRAFYTTADSVADIEAIRVAGGYEKLVLYGTSYGTKVAEQYAQDYPTHVEALVLDSVVGPNGPDELQRSTFAAIPGVLHELCAQAACKRITAHPTADLARIVRLMRRHPVRGRVIDGRGVGHTVRVSADDLLGILIAGDLAPVLRAQFPAAIHAALSGDTAALARLVAFAETPSEGGGDGINVPLYLTTSCEEERFAWNRVAPPATRLAQAIAQARQQSPSVYAPFTAANAIDLSDVRACAYWPFATSAPLTDDAPLPAVPTLILSGAADLRTPTAGARELAAQIPGSHLLVVPHTGHSVLGSDPTSCASDALDAMFAGKPIKQCTVRPLSSFARPTAVPPARLADVHPAKPYRGRLGRTLAAVEFALQDFSYQVELQGIQQLGPEGSLTSRGIRIGGLRAGWGVYAGSGITFHRYSYVPGVNISGLITTGRATLRIGGRAAAHGTLHLGPNGGLTGTLEGRAVRISKFKASATIARAARAGTRARIPVE